MRRLCYSMAMTRTAWIRTATTVLVLLCGLAAGLGSWIWQYRQAPLPLENEVTVRIPKGTGVRQIENLLAEQGVLRKDIRYLIFLRLTGLGPKLQAGEYRFTPGMSVHQALHKMATGDILQHFVTIAEGLHLEQIAAVFAQDGWADSGRFTALARDLGFIRNLGLDVSSLEGYLFPDTYAMVRDMREEELIRQMVQRFQQVWDTLAGPGTAGTAGLNRHQILTLASIVEKETGQAWERPLIARVFLNRLEQGMPLQSDPTVIYGLGADFTGNLRRADLQAPTPYNTYAIPALPPGPICSPGKAALEAVLQPATSKALYFVSKNDGSHVFSNTLAEHNRAVEIYQKASKKDTKQQHDNPAASPK